jgi:predicted esterase
MKNCTYVLRAILCLFVIAAGTKTGYSQQVEKSLISTTGERIGFHQFTPPGYATEGNVKHPLIIFLHGVGEKGNGTTELKNVANYGLPNMLKNGWDTKTTWNGKTETFIVLSPQCPSIQWMWPQAYIDDLLKYAKENLRIDVNRIYLTGLSMGAGGSNRYLSTMPNGASNFAAAGVICTPNLFTDGKYVAAAKLPYWAFHAKDDNIVSYTFSQIAVDKINAAGAEVKPKLTFWPTGGHMVWDRVYKDTNYKWDNAINIYEWFLGQNKTLPVNKLPVAKATGTTAITTGTGVTNLSGATSTDADGTIVRYVWRKISGPGAGVIKNTFGPNASTDITGLTVAGTYSYELTVVDNRASISKDTINVVVSNGASVPVPNIAPVAKAGNDITITLPTSKVTVNGNSSSDADGTIDVYLWTKVSGPDAFTIVNKSAAITEINNLEEGTYVFNLKVTDNKGATHDDQITVKVNPAPVIPNVAPVAKAGNDMTITLPTSKVTVNGSASTDSDGTIDVYLWTKASGPNQFTIVSKNASVTEINNLAEGTYVFNLKVTDNKGATHDDQVTVTVNPAPIPNVAPVANAGADKVITLPVNSVAVNANGSTDSDGTIVAWTWSYISGPSGANIGNVYASSTIISNLKEGSYKFRLVVRDNDGTTNSDTILITVKPEVVVVPPVDPPVDPPPAPVNQAPVADAGVDMEITLPDPGIRLNGLNSMDPDGEIVSYSWVQTGGASGITITNSTTKTPGIIGAKEGQYKFELTVTDDKGATAKDEVMLTVLAAPKDTTTHTDSIPDENLKYEEKVSVYPNPVAANMNVKYTSEHNGTARVSIYNMNGMLLHANIAEKKQVNYQQFINVSHLQRGVYYVEVNVEGHKTITKFLKN